MALPAAALGGSGSFRDCGLIIINVLPNLHHILGEAGKNVYCPEGQVVGQLDCNSPDQTLDGGFPNVRGGAILRA
jgi:hypothetical protein